MLLLLALTCVSGTLGADDDSPTVVMIASRAHQAKFEEVIEQMVVQFADSDVRFHVYWVDDIPVSLREQEESAATISEEMGALAVFWCDLEIGDKVYFYFATAQTGRVLVRRIEGVGDEGVGDAMAIISRTAVDGLLGGGQIDVTSPRPPPRSPEIEAAPVAIPPAPAPTPLFPEPKPEQLKQSILHFDASYTMSILSIAQGVLHGAAFAVGIDATERLSLFVGYSVFQSIEDGETGVEVKLRRHPFHIGAAVNKRVGKWSFYISMAIILDYLIIEPHGLVETMEVDDPYNSFKVSLEPVLRAQYRLSTTLSLFAAVGVETHFVKTRYEIIDGPTLMDDSWRVQPRLWLGAVLAIF